MPNIVIGNEPGDLDRVFAELSRPDVRIESRSRSSLRGSLGCESFAPARRTHANWSARCQEWLLGSALAVAELVSSRAWSARPSGRTASSTNGRGSSWASSATDGSRRCASSISTTRTAAFAYAEERMRAASSRLAVTNRASESVEAAATGDAGPRRRRARRALFGSVRIRRSAATERRPAQHGLPGCGRPSSASSSSTPSSRGARWRFEVNAWNLTGAAGRTTPGTRRHIYMCSSSATTGGSPMTAASTRTTSRAPTANSNAATTPARARRSRKRVPWRPSG